jgi:hypothetical protein
VPDPLAIDVPGSFAPFISVLRARAADPFAQAWLGALEKVRSENVRAK